MNFKFFKYAGRKKFVKEKVIQLYKIIIGTAVNLHLKSNNPQSLITPVVQSNTGLSKISTIKPQNLQHIKKGHRIRNQI